MNSKVKVAFITGLFSLAVGIVGTLGVSTALHNQNVVTVHVNGQPVAVTQDEYDGMYRELKENYDALFSENQKLKDEISALGNRDGETGAVPVKEEDAVYIGEQVKAYYQGTYYKEYSTLAGKSFRMGGKEYKSGFTMSGYGEEQACYNLEGKYATLSGLAGNLDGVNYGVIYGVYGDDTLLDTIKVEGAALPKEFTVDVSGVQQLKIAPTETAILGAGDKVGFANVVLK